MARNWFLAAALTVVALLVATPVVMAQDAGGEEPAAQTESFFSIIWKATTGSVIGFIDIFLIFCASIAGIALIIEHFLTIRRTVMLPEMTVAQIKTMFDERRFREALEFCQTDPSFVASVIHAGLIEAANGYQAMEKAMGDAAEERTARLFRKIEYLNLLGNVSPMLGLFGTVYGMMTAFATIASKGGTANPADLAEGIMVALFSTFLGLFAAIPALVGYAIFKNRIDALSIECTLVAEELLANFKPNKAAAQRQG